jgi:hypothetical protein
VFVGETRCDLPPRVHAMITRLVRDANEIAAMREGKIIFHIAGDSLGYTYEKIGDAIEL